MKKEIELLREQMRKENTDLYIVTTTDAHNSEYVSDHDRVLEYLTGFSGSNGTLLVTDTEALLWTDGRYFIQCEQEIAGSGIKMMREGDKRDLSVKDYIAKNLRSGQCIGFDGNNLTRHRVKTILAGMPDKDISLSYDRDMAGEIWDSQGTRPARPCNTVYEHDIRYAGESVNDKLKRVRKEINSLNASGLIISSLYDVMWLYNLRGSDVMYNPVALSYAFITSAVSEVRNGTDDQAGDLIGEAYLFIQPEALDHNVSEYLKSCGLIVRDYDEICDFISEYDYKGNVIADPRELSVKLYDAMANRLKSVSGHKIIDHALPTSELKACKNETEIRMMKEFFIRDSVAMTKYLYAVKKIMGMSVPEQLSAIFDDDDKLNDLIAEYSENAQDFDEVAAGRLCDRIRLMADGCFDLSFSTIAAYGANAAMMHYEAEEHTCAKIKRSGMLLTDCGGQYPGATTDVTRTIAVGDVTDEEKKCFTLVLKGWLALMHATWIEGCTGRNLDILARQYLWNEGIDYKCGTGHGVGYCLGVHEGPQNIRYRYIPDSAEAVLLPGMTVTNEPGVYKEGCFGIRTENTMLVTEKFVSDSDRYLGFENLTLVPIDMELVDMSLLDKTEIKQLEEYNSEAYKCCEEYLKR